MTSVRKWILDNEQEILLADGFDEAFIGTADRANFTGDVAVYDYRKCIDVLMARDGMEYDDAVDYLHINTIGAWVGEKTPIFVTLKDE